MKMQPNKFYGYPILSQYCDDYKENSFDFTTNNFHTDKIDGFQVNITLKNNFILELLKKDEIGLYFLIECGKTHYRKIFKCEKIDTLTINAEVPNEYLIDDVETICFLSTNKPIEFIANEEFDEFYNGKSVSIPQFCYIGYTPTYTETFCKRIDENTQVPSIFNISKKKESTNKEYNLNNNIILVSLPEEEYDYYMDIKSKTPRIIHSIFIEPALTYTLESIKNSQGDDYAGLDWYNVIKNKCDNLGYNFDSAKFKNTDSYMIAEKILKNPSKDALCEVKTITK